jgi:serine/threonine protein kinase
MDNQSSSIPSQIINDFEAVYRNGNVPRLQDFLLDDVRTPPGLVHKLIRLDVEYRRKRGLPIEVEHYLAAVHSLAEQEDLLIEVVEAEHRQRQERGEVSLLQEHARRFPAVAKWLSEWLLASTVDFTAATPGRRGESAAELPVLPGYEILSVLGKGGMGIVYKARHLALGRLVALKRIKGGTGVSSAELARFRTETEAVARLQHPNVVQIHEVGEHGGLPYFTMEYCGGGTLAGKLAGTPIPAPDAARLAETLARAMDAAHQKNIVHRDLKPHNIVLTEDGTPKIGDFGLARKLDAPAQQTHSGAILGTPSYMAPEQARGDAKALGPLVDVYALGAILYEMLTGRPPFKAATRLDTVFQVLNDEPVPVRQLNGAVPRDLETICLKCLHKEAGRRYAGAAEVADDLRRYQAGQPIEARPVGLPERMAKWVKRRPALAGLVLVAAAAMVALVGGLVYVADLNSSLNTANDDLKSSNEQLSLANAEVQRRLAQSHVDAARLAGQRGLWREAIKLYDQALAEGHPDVTAIRLDRIKARMNTTDNANVLVELDALAGKSQPGKHAALVDLYRGMFMTSLDVERAEKLIRRALQQELPLAERFFARAQVEAQTIPESLSFLQKAIAHDPYHLHARGHACFMLAALGELREARELALQTKALFPEDEDNHVRLAYIAILARDQAGTEQWLRRVPKDYRGVLSVTRDIMTLIDDAIPGPPSSLTGDSVSTVLFAARLSGLMLRLASVIPTQTVKSGNVIGMAPVFLLKTLPVSNLRSFMAIPKLLANNDQQQDAFLTDVLHVLPDATLTFVKARKSARVRDTATLELALKRKSSILRPDTLRACILDFLIWAESDGLVSVRKTVGPPPDKRALGHLRERLRLPFQVRDALWLNRFTAVAYRYEDLGLAQYLLADWERMHPRDPNLAPWKALVHWKSGAHAQALRAARQVASWHPLAPTMREVIRTTSEGLRKDLRELAPALKP